MVVVVGSGLTGVVAVEVGTGPRRLEMRVVVVVGSGWTGVVAVEVVVGTDGTDVGTGGREV